MSAETIAAPVGRASTSPRVTYTPDGLFRWDGSAWEMVERPIDAAARPQPVAEPELVRAEPMRQVTILHLILLVAALVIGATGLTVVGLTG